MPLLQEPTATQALDGEDVGTPVTHHQAAFTGPAHRQRHVGHTYARAQRMAHGKVYNLKPIQLHSWKHSPPSQTEKNMYSKYQQEAQGIASLCYGSRVATWPNRDGGTGRAGCKAAALIITSEETPWVQAGEVTALHQNSPELAAYCP